MSDTVGAHLSAAGVQIKPYEEAITYVRDMSGNEKLLNGKKIWCDGKTVNFAMYGSVPTKIRLDKESPITIMKATKNEVREFLRTNQIEGREFIAPQYLSPFRLFPHAHAHKHSRSSSHARTHKNRHTALKDRAFPLFVLISHSPSHTHDYVHVKLYEDVHTLPSPSL